MALSRLGQLDYFLHKPLLRNGHPCTRGALGHGRFIDIEIGSPVQ